MPYGVVGGWFSKAAGTSEASDDGLNTCDSGDPVRSA